MKSDYEEAMMALPEGHEIVAGHKRGELHKALTQLALDHGLIEVDAMLLVVKDDLEGGGS